MRKYLPALLCALLAVAVGLFLLLRPAHIANYPSQGTDIIAFGDSLVFGTGSKGGGFVSLLSQNLNTPIINLGVPGDTTADGLARLSQLDAYHPKVVLLLLGGNDYLKRVPPEQTFANLGKIIQNIESRGAIVLLLGVRGGILRDNFAGQYQALAKKYHTAHVSDVLDGLLGNQEYMYDEVHPNDLGYARIAARIEPVLKSLLQ